MKISGVYALKAINSKLLYIGSTKDLRIRKNLHFNSIKKLDSKRRCFKMAEAYENDDLITFEVIEKCDNLLEREQYYIDNYKSIDLLSEYTLINVFDADRKDSRITQEFRDRMSEIRKIKWKDVEYRKATLLKIKSTQFTSEKSSKKVLQFDSKTKKLINSFSSATIAAKELGYNKVSLSSAARGKFRNSHKYKGFLFIYEVLYKSDKLLEHQEIDNQQPI